MIRKKETSKDYKELTQNAIYWQIMDDMEELKAVWVGKHHSRKDLVKIAKTLNNLLYEIEG